MRRLLIVVWVSIAFGCARGDTDPGTAKDNCRLRDCGSAVGGQETDPEDEGFPEEDTGVPGTDSIVPPDTAVDTSPPKDTAVPPEDTACAPPAGAICSTYPQCGCAPGTNCDVTDVTGKTSCVMAGTKAIHAKCTGTGECPKGATCLYDVCMPFCSAAADCASTSVCRNAQYVEGGVTKDIPGMKICMAQCDPLNPSKLCGGSTTCLFSSPTTTTCAAAGLSTTAGTCAADPFTCAPGYVCVNTGDCTRWNHR